MRLSGIDFSKTEPRQTDLLWIKPVEDGVGFYLYNNGKWSPLRVMNTKGTGSTEDDQPYDLDAIGASKLSELEDVTMGTASVGQVLKFDGSTWKNDDDNTSTPGPDTVGTEQIIDNSVELEDLHDDVKNKIQKTYDESEESLSMEFDVVP